MFSQLAFHGAPLPLAAGSLMSTSCHVAEESCPCPRLRLRPCAVASNCEPVESVGTGPNLLVRAASSGGLERTSDGVVLAESVPMAAVTRKHLNWLWAA